MSPPQKIAGDRPCNGSVPKSKNYRKITICDWRLIMMFFRESFFFLGKVLFDLIYVMN